MIIRIILFQIIVISGIGCKNSNLCEKYSTEVYTKENSNLPDSTRLEIESFLAKINEPNIHTSKFESYRVLTKYTLSGTYNSFLFRKTDALSEIVFKEFEYDSTIKANKVIEETNILLSESDWEHLQYLIYKFKFWTEKEFKSRTVADGYGYVLEGYRPQAKSCSKKTSKVVLRMNSENDDNIIWLCDELISIYTHRD